MVPPGGARVRTLRIPRTLIAVIAAIIAAGFVGYFIPFNGFTLDVVKQNQERNLKDQNGKLAAMIRPLYRLRVTLSSELDRLDRKRVSILEKFGRKEGGRPRVHGKGRAHEASPGDLVAKVKVEEELFRGIVATLARRPGFLDSIPLIKPVGDKSMVSAHFSLEMDPFTGTIKHHFGTDFIGVRGPRFSQPHPARWRGLKTARHGENGSWSATDPGTARCTPISEPLRYFQARR